MNQMNEGIPQKICKERTCKRKFTNNGRNTQQIKDFCSSSCSSKNANREYRKLKYFKEKNPDILSIFLERTFNKKETRLLFEFILNRVRMSKMDRTLFLIEILETNKLGGYN